MRRTSFGRLGSARRSSRALSSTRDRSRSPATRRRRCGSPSSSSRSSLALATLPPSSRMEASKWGCPGWAHSSSNSISQPRSPRAGSRASSDFVKEPQAPSIHARVQPLPKRGSRSLPKRCSRSSTSTASIPWDSSRPVLSMGSSPKTLILWATLNPSQSSLIWPELTAERVKRDGHDRSSPSFCL